MEFQITSAFSPADLFVAVKSISDSLSKKNTPLKFDFDWLKRKVAFLSNDEQLVEKAAAQLHEKITAQLGPGSLIPGDCKRLADGRYELPIGVLIQTPDVYTEMIVESLKEMNIPVASISEDGSSFTLLGGAIAGLLPVEDYVTSFPIPSYMTIKRV